MIERGWEAPAPNNTVDGRRLTLMCTRGLRRELANFFLVRREINQYEAIERNCRDEQACHEDNTGFAGNPRNYERHNRSREYVHCGACVPVYVLRNVHRRE